MLLEKINSPGDISKLTYTELHDLATEIRQKMILTVAANGGHLASNLGMVEVTLAIHRVFSCPRDKIIFDVGHQCYTHKILTGRSSIFHTLRKYKGMSGFPSPTESEYDAFGTGHASTSLSAALGMCRARDFKHQDHHVIAVVGDGALTGGMIYEALNDAGNGHTRLIIILNDNEMSIAHNVGALAQYLLKLRSSSGWRRTKIGIRKLNELPLIGKSIYDLIHHAKRYLKSKLFHIDTAGYFEALGIHYIGPANGHDIHSVEGMLREAAEYNGPVLVHVLTKKGFGYDKAEERPEVFHGTPPFYIESGQRRTMSSEPSNGHVMANSLNELLKKDDRVVAISAAMELGTGLDHLAKIHPDRVIDVGIAEEHAVTMAAGLAAGGMRPYVAIYSTFFQRCHDQLIHDVCMQKLPVVFLLDRSGISGEDGQTHHGVFDLAETLPVPNLNIYSPRDASELKEAISCTLATDCPCIIRYSKTGYPLLDEKPDRKIFKPGKWNVIKKGKDITILAIGDMVRTALEVCEILAKRDIDAEAVSCASIRPVDTEYLKSIRTPFFTIENHMLTGGFGMYVCERCIGLGIRLPSECFAVPSEFISHGNHNLLMRDAGLTAEQISDKILSINGQSN